MKPLGGEKWDKVHSNPILVVSRAQKHAVCQLYTEDRQAAEGW